MLNIAMKSQIPDFFFFFFFLSLKNCLESVNQSFPNRSELVCLPGRGVTQVWFGLRRAVLWDPFLNQILNQILPKNETISIIEPQIISKIY